MHVYDEHTGNGEIPEASLPLRLLFHLLFWLLAMGIMYLLYARLLDSGSAAAFVLLYTLPVYITTVYVTTGITIPRTLLRRRYARFLLYSAYTVLGVFFLLIVEFFLLVLGVLPLPPLQGYTPPRNAVDIVVLSAGIFVVTLMASVITLLRHWYAADRRTQRLRQERLTAELAMLRSQVHPHFLFNTLNNLYALTLQKSDRASEVVLKLSELLDYMLYESRNEFVSVEREVRLLEHYLDLERMRHGPRVRISWENDLRAALPVAPLLFLPIVENCFKHGVSRDSGDAWVEVALRAGSSDIHFEARNSLPAEREASKQQAPGSDATENDAAGSGGIGLRNVRERLNLLYPGRHDFSLTTTGNVFEVRLDLYRLSEQ
ncbi:sensor histidine kinase [bacterium]|nr:sensor histidine kinase [bacterium]